MTKSRDVTLSGSMFCATGSCAISTLVGPFWPEVTSVTCPEVALTRSSFCACPVFSRVFFLLVVVAWVPLGVRMRNRKLCSTRSSSKQCWLGCSLRRLRHHQSPSTDNSHQEVLRAKRRMDVASYEERSDPESLRMERTEKDHTFIWRKRARTDNWKCVK